MNHMEVSELLATYALDATEPDESRQIESHLETCPRCRSELDAHREVAAALGNSVEPVPDGLWENIESRLPERPLEGIPPMPSLGQVPATEERRTRPGRVGARSPRLRTATIGALALAASVTAVVFGIDLVRADNQISQLQGAVSSAPAAVVKSALALPGHQLVDLRSPAHSVVAKFVVLPDGRGYLVSSSLRALANSKTYQLWAIVGGQPISVGLLGQSPYQSTFTLDGAKASKLAITVEPAGGSVVPSSPMVAAGVV